MSVVFCVSQFDYPVRTSTFEKRIEVHRKFSVALIDDLTLPESFHLLSVFYARIFHLYCLTIKKRVICLSIFATFLKIDRDMSLLVPSSDISLHIYMFHSFRRLDIGSSISNEIKGQKSSDDKCDCHCAHEYLLS